MPPFKVVSDFAPAGDQPQAIEELAGGLTDGERFQTLLGITGSGKSATIAWTIEQAQRPTLVIAPNKSLAAQLTNEFKEFFPENRVEYFVSYYDYYQPEAYIASSDTYIEKDSSINDDKDPYRQMPSIGANFGGQSLPANDSERVPRSELDLALYMLHQRDMRCEEMTHELINLLEERDTLQLRLSNAIRHFEEMRMKFNLPEPESTEVSKTTTPEKSTNVAGSTDGTETTSVDENLQTKLTEINNLRLSRDRGVLEEREQRFQQNMSMIQRDVMNLPQEAAARIVG
jgi:hypothetical protein